MQWCFDVVSGIGWGSLLLMIGAVGAFWLVAALGMAVLFRTSIPAGRRRASLRPGPHSRPVLAEDELGRPR